MGAMLPWIFLAAGSPPVAATEMDLVRARQIVRALEPLKGLAGDDFEVVGDACPETVLSLRQCLVCKIHIAVRHIHKLR